jgi:hypothetical protein
MGLVEILKLKDEGGFRRSSETDLHAMLNECESQIFGRMAAEAKQASDAIRAELARRSNLGEGQASTSAGAAQKTSRLSILAIIISLSALGLAGLSLYLRWRDGHP